MGLIFDRDSDIMCRSMKVDLRERSMVVEVYLLLAFCFFTTYFMEVGSMKCEKCQAKMNSTKTELDISVKGKSIKAVNVPSMTCPECNNLVVKDSVNKTALSYAKHCKGDTFDYEKEESAAAIAAAAAASVVI